MVGQPLHVRPRKPVPRFPMGRTCSSAHRARGSILPLVFFFCHCAGFVARRPLRAFFSRRSRTDRAKERPPVTVLHSSSACHKRSGLPVLRAAFSFVGLPYFFQRVFSWPRRQVNAQRFFRLRFPLCGPSGHEKNLVTFRLTRPAFFRG